MWQSKGCVCATTKNIHYSFDPVRSPRIPFVRLIYLDPFCSLQAFFVWKPTKVAIYHLHACTHETRPVFTGSKLLRWRAVSLHHRTGFFVLSCCRARFTNFCLRSQAANQPDKLRRGEIFLTKCDERSDKIMHSIAVVWHFLANGWQPACNRTNFLPMKQWQLLRRHKPAKSYFSVFRPEQQLSNVKVVSDWCRSTKGWKNYLTRSTGRSTHIPIPKNNLWEPKRNKKQCVRQLRLRCLHLFVHHFCDPSCPFWDMTGQDRTPDIQAEMPFTWCSLNVMRVGLCVPLHAPIFMYLLNTAFMCSLCTPLYSAPLVCCIHISESRWSKLRIAIRDLWKIYVFFSSGHLSNTFGNTKTMCQDQSQQTDRIKLKWFLHLQHWQTTEVRK